MKPDKQTNLYQIRHSLAHMLAEAVLDMFPDAKLGTGPVTENGFYYDFELPRTLIPEDLPLIQKRMKKYVQQGQNFVRRDEPIAESIAFLKKIKQPFKIDLVNKFVEQQKIKVVSFYENFIPQKEEPVFVDLCEGGHVGNTKEIDPKSFKLSHISSAYWQADENNPSMQRIYGISFETAQELKDYEKMMEEAKKRDHRRLGKDLELYVMSPKVGPGFPLLAPKGEIIRHELEKFSREKHVEWGYNYVRTPNLGHLDMYRTSGHYPYYADSMFPPLKDDEEEFMLRPMNCPHHIQIFANRPHSYRELPLRLREDGLCFRYEQSGELSGLTRVRSFSIDDAHIFCTPDQMEEEINRCIDLSEEMYNLFGLNELTYVLSLRGPSNPEKYGGTEENWEKSQKILRDVLTKRKVVFDELEGEAAFYGPKIDVKARDVLGREWQLATIPQVDYHMPEAFDLHYIDSKGDKQRPIILHRAVYGSYERFMALLIEHFAGAFPAWLAPVQVEVLPIAEPHLDYAIEVREALRAEGVRAKILPPDEGTLGKRIRFSEKQKIPYMLVLGDKEKEAGSVNVRSYHTKKEKSQKLSGFVKKIVKEISERELPEKSEEEIRLLNKMATAEKKKSKGGASGDKIKQFIEENNIPYEGISHKKAASVLECQKVYGTQLNQQAKALLVKYKDTKGRLNYAVVTLPASKEADLEAIKKLLKAKEIKLANRKELKEKTGCIFGEMPPLGKVFGLQLIMDKDLLNEPKVYWNAGRLDFSMVTDPKDIKKVEKPIMF